MDADPHLGKTYGNVRLSAKLGQGAMGAVYKGWHQRFERDVAVKVLLSQSGRGHSRERFLREGQAAAKIQHENVVQVMDAGEQDGIAYLVMELVDGYSLGKIADEAGPLPPEAVARLGAGIALGLAAIHAKGVIHRDIKPDNILVGHDKRPKITDLGLAKQTDDPELNRLTATGMVVGTPLYVSPEAIRDPKTATVAADIYSLGATLYHLITGRPPFQADSPYEVMRAHLEQRPRPVRELIPATPVGLAQVVERCLHKTPEKRPSALQLADLLSQGARLKASPNRGLALLVGVAAVVVVGVASLGWLALDAQRERAVHEAKNAALVLRVDRPGTRLRLDEGDWAPLAAAPLALAPGHHHLAVEAVEPGPLLAWEGDVEVADRQRLELPVALAPIPVAEARIPVPGDGMLFCDGTAFGLEPSFPVRQAGTYALARWNGEAWQALTASVDARGLVKSTPAARLDHPGGGAYWRAVDDSGAACAPHHLVCWWEAEQARERAHLPAPPGWTLQGQRREQPALGLTPALIGAVRDWLGPQVATLPDHDQARRFMDSYQAPIWCAGQERLDFVGGSPHNALLVVMPATAAVQPAGR
jgi:serine/threonine-protein kinase